MVCARIEPGTKYRPQKLNLNAFDWLDIKAEWLLLDNKYTFNLTSFVQP